MTNPNDTAYPAGNEIQPGLTKREYFSAIAMQGVEAANNPLDNNDIMNPTEIARRAVRMADALIEALNKEGK